MTKRTYILYDWEDGSERRLQVVYNEGVYQLLLEGEYVGDYSSMVQVNDKIVSMMKQYGWHIVPQD